VRASRYVKTPRRVGSLWVGQERKNGSNYRAIQQRVDRRPILTHVTHSKMLETRRRKKRAKKDFAGIAKRAKKVRKQDAKTAAAGAPKSP